MLLGINKKQQIADKCNNKVNLKKCLCSGEDRNKEYRLYDSTYLALEQVKLICRGRGQNSSCL